MFCKNCGIAVTYDEVYCHNCGAALKPTYEERAERQTLKMRIVALWVQ